MACECLEALKAVYGLRVSPRVFQEHFVRKVTKRKFKRSVADPQGFFGIGDFDGGFMAAWVDDVMIVAPQDVFESIVNMLEEKVLLKRGPMLSNIWRKYGGR